MDKKSSFWDRFSAEFVLHAMMAVLIAFTLLAGYVGWQAAAVLKPADRGPEVGYWDHGVLRIGDAEFAAQAVVGVIEPRVDVAVGCVVDQMQQVAGQVVLVGRVGAVAHVLAGQPRGAVVGVPDDEVAAAEVQDRQREGARGAP